MIKQDATTVRGMRDFLPQDVAIRRSIQSRIQNFYASKGYGEIETPALERKELLFGSGGGENEKLIFKVLKRGNKLKETLEKEDDLIDCGLRFDLTLPLSRYYALHAEKLGSSFKSLHIGQVWRAEKPQQGRFRQFTQCDIDILGESSWLAELDLICTTAECLIQLGFKGFEICLNHRVLLTHLLISWDIPEDQHEKILILLDKVDKIGLANIRKELDFLNLSLNVIDQIMNWLDNPPSDVKDFITKSSNYDQQIEQVVSELTMLTHTVEFLSNGLYKIKYDPLMIRGMGYYTGAIFEIKYRDYPYSLGGGGRYDNMIGRFLGRQVPACGFSLGFDRIVGIIEAEGLLLCHSQKGAVIVINEISEFKNAYSLSTQLRNDFSRTLITRRSKNLKRQLSILNKDGYTVAYFINGEEVTKREILV
ncbi:histidine--tRNA ligase [Acinetobacter pittii]|uniref:histidine--tRNA ligase n=1 Tax=Acinetobacter pittii TaxID=48296 RepID=UPI0021D1DE69|nr:histidine--tRNA ligase [Acinetobacter pittii]MCU4528184.1 histidine--tRNA ligase [Acinetobacter pittii]